MDRSALDWCSLCFIAASPLRIARALAECRGEPDAALRSLVGQEADGVRQRARQALQRLPRLGLGLVHPGLDAYPPLLREIPDAPPALFVRGELLPDDDPAVAVVGARKATPYGLAVARHFAEELAAAGLTVVSGLARGIDAAAHQGTLIPPEGRGIAVLGCGPDRIYPAEHRQLGEALVERGAVVSEFPPGTPPRPGHFPRRNRLISGMVRAVVVVEAALGSGSLITARLALDQGREVLAVPGPVTSETSRGANELLRQGARLVGTPLDVVEEFPEEVKRLLAERLALRRKGTPPGLNEAELEIWKELDPAEPKGVGALGRATRLGTSALVSALLGLEIRGLARALPGARYVRGDWTGGG